MNAVPTNRGMDGGAVSPAPTFSWRAGVTAIVAVLLCLVGLYHDTGLAMVRIWARSETFNHAFLVPLIVIWLIWEKRAAVACVAPKPEAWLAIPFAGLAFGWLLGDLASVNAVTQLAFVGMLVLAVPLVIGLQAARIIAFPLVFLFFAVPIGEFIMPKLMEWTATFTVLGLRLTGIPVYQEGLHFVIPSGRWSVVEACSGVRYLIASITIGTLYAYLNYRSLRRRLVFVGVSILVPVIANWARAYIIVMLGHLSGNELATGVDHLIYGWVFFGVVIMIMFAIGMRWREDEISLPPMASGASAKDADTVGTVSKLAFAAALTVAVALAPRFAVNAIDAGSGFSAPSLFPRHLAVDGWELSGEQLTDWVPAFANPSASLAASLSKDERRVGVYVAWYQNQNYERKLISSNNDLVKSDHPEWSRVRSEMRQVRLGQETYSVRSGILRKNPANIGTEPLRLHVMHWYWVGGRVTSSDHLGKLWLALDRLVGKGDDSAAVFVYALESQPQGADAALAEYLAEAGGGIAALLEGARKDR